jgi:acetylornithine deacetylase/succinyl-diaminopimelate desuccinylase-like protein
MNGALPALLLFSIFPAFGLTPGQELAKDIYRQLIEIDTADSAANVTDAAEAMAHRLRQAGFSESEIHVDGDDPRFKNLVARYAGSGQHKPILLLAHLDVVEARRSDWSLDPFHFTEKDGYFYGRGTVDDKAEAACWIANLITYKKEGYKPDRDIIVALTSGEESGEHNGVEWLLKNRRDWLDAELALNEGGDGGIRDGKKVANYVQASEKVYYSVRLKAADAGGHSSMPRKDNPIYWLSAALLKISQYQFPVELNPVTRLYFERTGKLSRDPLAAAMRALASNPGDRAAIDTLSADPHENAMMRTTCVATEIEGGHAENALPQSATAIVNCRLLPEDKPEDVLAKLRSIVDDTHVELTEVKPAAVGPASPLSPFMMNAVERSTNAIWPGIPVIPTMSTGATDGRMIRQAGIPCYGVSGFFIDEADTREHGRDERMLAESFFDGQKFLYGLVKRLTGGRGIDQSPVAYASGSLSSYLFENLRRSPFAMRSPSVPNGWSVVR